MRRVAVIMAGGSGERFWPLSRMQRPKQLLNLTDPDRTMLAEAVDRVTPLVPKEHVYIATGRHLVAPIRSAEVGVAGENILAEPCKRNTAGCLVYAAASILARYGGDGTDISMAVLTADHIIGCPEQFRATLAEALEVVEREDALGTIGIKPTRAETGYGYIQVGDNTEGLSNGAVSVKPVAAFHEKPDADTAKQFVESGNFFWNSGMFFWKVSTFLNELEKAQPAMAHAAREITQAIKDGDDPRVDAIFEDLESISIDYALMEKADKVVVVEGCFPWDDIGAWTALDRTYPHDEDGNVTYGNPVVVDSKNCIVYSEVEASQVAVSVVGAEDLVVVVTEDAVLVMPKDKAQDVKKAVTELKKRNAPQV